jgi:hypothetical protein
MQNIKLYLKKLENRLKHQKTDQQQAEAQCRRHSERKVIFLDKFKFILINQRQPWWQK